MRIGQITKMVSSSASKAMKCVQDIMQNYKPAANVTQVAVDISFLSRSTYVKSAAVPPPKECPTICKKPRKEIVPLLQYFVPHFPEIANTTR